MYKNTIKTPVPLLKNSTLSSKMPCVFFLKISKHLVNRGGLASGRPPAIAQRVGSLAARYHAVLALKAEVLGVFFGKLFCNWKFGLFCNDLGITDSLFFPEVACLL